MESWYQVNPMKFLSFFFISTSQLVGNGQQILSKGTTFYLVIVFAIFGVSVCEQDKQIQKRLFFSTGFSLAFTNPGLLSFLLSVLLFFSLNSLLWLLFITIIISVIIILSTGIHPSGSPPPEVVGAALKVRGREVEGVSPKVKSHGVSFFGRVTLGHFSGVKSDHLWWNIRDYELTGGNGHLALKLNHDFMEWNIFKISSKKIPTDPWNIPQVSQNTNMKGFPS